MGRMPKLVAPKISADLRWRWFVGISREPEAVFEPFYCDDDREYDILDGRDLLALIAVVLDLFEWLAHLLLFLEVDPVFQLDPGDLLNWDHLLPLDRKSLGLRVARFDR